MRTHVCIIAAMIACGALPLAAAAQPVGEVQQRFDNQQQRINNGVATGALTRGEAARDEGHLRADEALRNRQRIRDDGRSLTAGQKARDNHLLNHNSARIYDTKHNGAVGLPR